MINRCDATELWDKKPMLSKYHVLKKTNPNLTPEDCYDDIINYYIDDDG